MHNEEPDKKTGSYFVFQLYITGASPNSSRAITNLKRIFDKELDKNYDLEIIDVYQHPVLAKRENIIALPLLIKKRPLPERRLIGDMSDTMKLMSLIGMEKIEE
jgi:circadian clock protein KaiB